MDTQDRITIEADDESGARKETGKTVRMLSFRLGAENYCINITDAKEVFSPNLITRIPNTPAFIAGVTNLHGAVIPLIDIRGFLGIGRKEGLAGAKAIVTNIGTDVVGIMVDEVDSALDIKEADIQPPLATIKGKMAEFVRGQVGVGTEIFVLLELDKILGCEEITRLRKGES